jgi:hypothetical protein
MKAARLFVLSSHLGKPVFICFLVEPHQLNLRCRMS